MVQRKIIQVDDSSPLVSSKKKKKTILTLVVLISVVVVISGVFYFSTRERVVKISDYTVGSVKLDEMNLSTEASGSVVLPIQMSIGSPENGYVESLLVDVGDVITTETVLAKIDVPDLETELSDLEKSLKTQELKLEQLKLDQEFTIKEQNISLKRLNTKIEDAEKDVETAKQLMDLKSSRKSDYDSAIDTLNSLNEEKEDLLLNIDKTKRVGELDLLTQEAQIDEYKTSIERVLEEMDDTNIKSSISGTILDISDSLIVPGTPVSEGSELFTIADTTKVFFDLEVYEEYKSALKIGGVMDVLVSSKIVKAEIIQIGNVASLSSDSLASTIVVRAKPLEEVELTSGASAVAEISLGTESDVMLLPRGAYLTTGNQRYVYVIQGNKAYKTKVTFGQMDGSLVEVVSGLNPGDQIIVSSYQSFIDMDEVELIKE